MLLSLGFFSLLTIFTSRKVLNHSAFLNMSSLASTAQKWVCTSTGSASWLVHWQSFIKGMTFRADGLGTLENGAGSSPTLPKYWGMLESCCLWTLKLWPIRMDDRYPLTSLLTLQCIRVRQKGPNFCLVFRKHPWYSFYPLVHHLFRILRPFVSKGLWFV